MPDPAKLPVLPNITIPQIPEIPALPQVNGEGYKNIAKNIDQTVNTVFNSTRVGTAYVKSVMDGLQNKGVDPAVAQKMCRMLQSSSKSVSIVFHI